MGIVQIYLKAAKKSGGGLICLHCGGGKTVIAINLISCLKKKTIVVVHKEFLVNQWIERVEQFLPDARIGKIQGPKFDIDNKDIVIAMLQTISMKEFPKNAFDSFGFAVADECFVYNTPIITNKGICMIGDLYLKWINKQPIPEILSYNLKKNKFEYKKMTYA